MLAGEFRFESREGQIHGYFHNGEYFISDGHHRVNAALEIFWEHRRSDLSRRTACARQLGEARTATELSLCDANNLESSAGVHGVVVMLNDINSALSIFACDALHPGIFTVPAFSVSSGKVARLLYDENSEFAGESRTELLTLLGKSNELEQVSARGDVVVVQPAVPRRGFVEKIHRQTTAEWLGERTSMSPIEAETLLHAREIDPQCPLSYVAGSPRILLGLLAALSTSAQTLVLFTAGYCDPLGVRTALRTLFDRLGNRSAIYVASPTDWDFPEFQFANTVSVRRSTSSERKRVAG